MKKAIKPLIAYVVVDKEKPELEIGTLFYSKNLACRLKTKGEKIIKALKIEVIE